MASDMAKKMGMGEDEVTQVEIAGILHDIGTIGFPMDLIEKRMEDRCSREEAEQYKRHSEEGQNIIAFINRLDTVGILIRHHHERYDGKGYPDRLLEGEIPPGSRIISVADRYDRIMIRKFKKNDPFLENYIKGSTLNISHFSEEELVQQAAIHHIKQNVFIEFDPDVVKAFLGVLDDKGINPARERSLTFPELETGMILTRPVYTSSGRFLLPGNTTLSETVLTKLKTYYDNNEAPALFFTMVR
jgi:response regulator RpfG family c-di-GMP phosphodiesterase